MFGLRKIVMGLSPRYINVFEYHDNTYGDFLLSFGFSFSLDGMTSFYSLEGAFRHANTLTGKNKYIVIAPKYDHKDGYYLEYRSHNGEQFKEERWDLKFEAKN